MCRYDGGIQEIPMPIVVGQAVAKFLIKKLRENGDEPKINTTKSDDNSKGNGSQEKKRRTRKLTRVYCGNDSSRA